MKDKFVKALRNVAYPVCVVSSRYNDREHAITVSSVTSVSLSPPSLLVCINQESSIIESIHKGACVNVNFLGSSQKDIASICSSRERANERFDNECWVNDANNIPFLKNAEATALSEVINVLEYETHWIVLLEVNSVILNNQGYPDPLLYCNGVYLDKLPAIGKFQ